jgi:uncharacterized small protein (DUF1192 family)
MITWLKNLFTKKHELTLTDIKGSHNLLTMKQQLTKIKELDNRINFLKKEVKKLETRQEELTVNKQLKTIFPKIKTKTK